MPHTPFHKGSFLDDRKGQYPVPPPEEQDEEVVVEPEEGFPTSPSDIDVESQTLDDILKGEGFGDFADYSGIFGDNAAGAIARKWGVSADVAEKYILPFQKDNFNKLLAQIPKWKQNQLFNIVQDFQNKSARIEEQRAQVTGQADIAKKRTDEMKTQRDFMFGRELSSDQYASLSDADKAQYFHFTEELGTDVVVGGMSGRQLQEEQTRLQAEFGDDPGVIGGLLGQEFDETKRQTAAMYGDDPPKPIPDVDPKTGRRYTPAEKDFLTQRQEANQKEVLLKGTEAIGGLAGQQFKELRTQLEQQYGEAEGEDVAGVTGRKLSLEEIRQAERRRRLESAVGEDRKQLQAQFGDEGIVSKELEETQRQLRSSLSEKEKQLAAEFGTGDQAGFREQQRILAEKGARREFVTGVQGLQGSLLQQSMQNRMTGAETRGFQKAGGQTFMQQMQGEQAAQQYEALKGALTAKSEETDLQRSIDEEAQRAGYANLKEAETAGGQARVIELAKVAEAKRRGYASVEEAEKAGEADLGDAAETLAIQKAEQEEAKRAGFASLRQELASAAESRRTAVNAAGIREARALESARAGRETFAQRAITESEKQRIAGKDIEISEAVAEEAKRMGLRGAELSDIELAEARRQTEQRIDEEEQAKYSQAESLLSDYLRGTQQQALRLYEMGEQGGTGTGTDFKDGDCPEGYIKCPEGTDFVNSCQPTQAQCNKQEVPPTPPPDNNIDKDTDIGDTIEYWNLP